MAEKTVTRIDLADAVYREVGLTRRAAQDMVEDVFEIMSKALERGELVKLSSFGNFSVRSKRERIGRNPKTGQEVPITPRKVLSFRASHILKDRISGKIAKKSAAR